MQAPSFVVAEVRTDNGIGGQNTQTYTYEALRAHLEGAGNLGFARMTVMDDSTGIKTESNYIQDFANFRQGLLKSSRTIAPDSTVLGRADGHLGRPIQIYDRLLAACLPQGAEDGDDEARSQWCADLRDH